MRSVRKVSLSGVAPWAFHSSMMALNAAAPVFGKLSGLARELDDADESARRQHRGAHAEKTALAHAHVNGAIDTERVHQREQIARRIPGGEMTAGIGGSAVSPLIPRDAAP